MEKRNKVVDWLHGMADTRPYRSFSAGECARESGVSVNTAKKYLRSLVRESAWLYDYSVEMRNGLVAKFYAFNVWEGDN